MPDFDTLPGKGSLTVEDAILAGRKSITYPCRNIQIAYVLLAIIVPIVLKAFWPVPVFLVAGYLVAMFYDLWAIPRWRLWAYSGVWDIHQFQRSAELEGLLPKQSPMRRYGIMNKEQRATLAQLQQRFEQDEPFADNPEVPAVTQIQLRPGAYLVDGPPQQITLSNESLYPEGMPIYSWGDVHDEAVVTKSSGHTNDGGNSFGRGYASTEAYFSFYTTNSYVAIPLTDYNITLEQLDILLYTYRGRYEQARRDEVIIPIPRRGRSTGR